MAQRRRGTVVYRLDLSPLLMIIRLKPEIGRSFPPSRAGQYIALSCDECGLTTQIGTGTDGKRLYGPDLDETGAQRTGAVTHSYSIASAPWEQEQHGYLEFYLALERLSGGGYGRMSSVFAELDPASEHDRALFYLDRIVGTFTLDDRAPRTRDQSVLMIGTGTGLAPFVAMTKQLHYEATHGRGDGRRYTLLHTNRTYQELGYHDALLEIERSGSFDFVYIPTVSRPTARDTDDPALGTGRANNVLRHLFGLPTKEHEAGQASRDILEPTLPAALATGRLRKRLDPPSTKILACGNPAGLSDLEQTARRLGIGFDKEAW